MITCSIYLIIFMYFFNLKALTKQLKEKNMPERDKFLYTLFLGIIGSILIYSPKTNPYLELTLTLFNTVLIVSVLYKINGGAKGEYFLEKFVSLSWIALFRLLIPALLSLFVLAIFIGVVLAIYSHQTGVPLDSLSMINYQGIVLICVNILLLAFQLWRLSLYFKKTL